MSQKSYILPANYFSCMILGVTGNYCSGKDTIAELLKEKGFVHISLSDLIREEAKKREITETRENLVLLGNELRRQHGNSILALRAIQKMDFKKECVITSIRHPAEVEFLKKQQNFKLVQVSASQTIRWQRMQVRQANHDLKTFQDFQNWEAKEASSLNTSAQQLNTVMKMSDHIILNEESLAKLQHELDKLLKIINV